MDVVKNQLARIQQQLSGLTPSQKMLTAALVAIMVMTLLYWGRQAGTAEMAPVLDQPIAKGDISAIVAQLKRTGIDARVDADRVLVPADRVHEALAELAYSSLLPENSETGFDQMVAKLSPWASASERAALENRGKEITCAQIIRLFPGVQQAQVMIDPTSTRNIGRPNIEPSATVNITMRDAAGAKKAAEAAASVVSGAQANLARGRINVVVNGQPQRLRDATGAGGLAGSEDQLDEILKHKQLFENDILAVLPPVPDLRVAVSVKLNRDQKTTREQVVDGEKTVSKPTHEESEDLETRDGPPAREPGAVPNLGPGGTANEGLEIPSDGGVGGGGGGQTTISGKQKTELQVLPSYNVTETKFGSGEARVTSASVRVPWSYFLQVWKQRNPDKPADDAAVEALVQEKVKVFEKLVRGSVGMGEKDVVVVAPYDDIVPLAPLAPPQTATASIPLVIGNHSKEIALGGLALVSLFMVSMFVKRSAPAPLAAAAGAAGAAGSAGGQPATLLAGEALAGEAGDGKATLDGMELDDEAVRTQQMLDQVSTLVTDNPDAAASLVKRWLNRD
jgi:flagellar biosynthesis/type III secretory pathway M-ring protein FliF/YscJ